MFKETIDKIKNEVYKIVNACGRNSEDIKILAVSKTHPIDIVKLSLEQGIEFIAENKVQEAESKIPYLKGLYREFHFIGHLQSNKINKLLSLKPDLIHSVDKLSTLYKLENALTKLNDCQEVLIEVNTSGEDSKNGITPNELSDFLREADKLKFIKIKGLMTIGTLTEDEVEIRRCFRQLKELFEFHKRINYINVEMKYLSMGMSGDYKIAIEEGSHIIRLGSIIYGNRNYSK